jgi:hypothetical protein
MTNINLSWTQDTACPTGTGNGALTVTVYDADGNPFTTGATVTVKNSSGATAGTGTSDANGVASFAGLPAGTYNISASATGYVQGSPSSQCVRATKTVPASVSLVDASTGTNTFTLKVSVADNHNNAVTYQVAATDGTTSLVATLNSPALTTVAQTWTGLAPGKWTITVCIVGASDCNLKHTWKDQTLPAHGYTCNAYLWNDGGKLSGAPGDYAAQSC